MCITLLKVDNIALLTNWDEDYDVNDLMMLVLKQ